MLPARLILQRKVGIWPQDGVFYWLEQAQDIVGIGWTLRCKTKLILLFPAPTMEHCGPADDNYLVPRLLLS